MATITTEFGKLSSKKQRAVYLLVRDKKTVKRIITGVKVDESEISPKTKKIKNFEKAQIVEKLKSELAANLSSMAPEINYSDNMDATKIASKIVKKKKVDTLDFFSFAELWIYHYDAVPGSRVQMARDCFILSFCLMGMNSVDMYMATKLEKGVLKYKRAKTKDRRADEAYIEVKIHPFIKPLMKRYDKHCRCTISTGSLGINFG